MPLTLSNDRNECANIARWLARLLPQLAGDELYVSSLEHFVVDEDYRFAIDGDEGSDEPTAVALLRLYRTPFDGKIVVAVEAAWLDDDPGAQQRFWEQLFALLGGLFKGIYVTGRSVNDPEAFERLRRAGRVDRALTRELMVTLSPLGRHGLYSAFADGPAGKNVHADCLCLYSMAGAPAPEEGLLYRGDGRLDWDGHWHFGTHEQLAARIVQDGFPARGAGAFDGTVRDQICQQGYVDTPTVSLTASRDVGVVYATSSGSQPGVVFALDPALLRATGEVYDSYATMVQYCNSIRPNVFDALRDLVVSFGIDRDGLRRAGAFLREADQRAARASLLVPAPEPASLVTPEASEQAARAGVSEEMLVRLHAELAAFWMSTHSHGMLELVVTADGEVVETPIEAHIYAAAFDLALPELGPAYELRLERGGDPGWDLTPLGYIAKTCRDREFFSTGPVGGECIVAATIVDRNGNDVKELPVERLRAAASA